MFCASATADSRAKDLVPVNAFKPTPYGLCCWTFEGGCSVVVGLLLSVTPIMGIYNSSVFCSAFLCAHSSFCNHLYGEERAGRFAFFVFHVSRGCCVALPHGATELSAVCDCGIF